MTGCGGRRIGLQIGAGSIERVGELKIVKRCRIDEPAMAGGIGIDRNVAGAFQADHLAGEISDAEGDGMQRGQLIRVHASLCPLGNGRRDDRVELALRQVGFTRGRDGGLHAAIRGEQRRRAEAVGAARRDADGRRRGDRIVRQDVARDCGGIGRAAAVGRAVARVQADGGGKPIAQPDVGAGRARTEELIFLGAGAAQRQRDALRIARDRAGIKFEAMSAERTRVGHRVAHDDRGQ
ncbi:hypothetical protein ACVMIH_005067 [Bradyrhizobium sp. USDA 4503]